MARSVPLRVARRLGVLLAIAAIAVLILLAATVVPAAFAVACLAALTVAAAVFFAWTWATREEQGGPEP